MRGSPPSSRILAQVSGVDDQPADVMSGINSCPTDHALFRGVQTTAFCGAVVWVKNAFCSFHQRALNQVRRGRAALLSRPQTPFARGMADPPLPIELVRRMSVAIGGGPVLALDVNGPIASVRTQGDIHGC